MPDRHIWRIATDTPLYEADDLSGAGAQATGGRWNEAGLAMVYASSSIALACLETLVHLNAGGLPFNRYLVQIAVPGDIWAAAKTETPATLKVGWEAQPAGRASIAFGSDWLRSGATTLLRVPSAIVPEEANILINPAHPGASRIGAAKVRRWLYDPRLGMR
jgi:RES domain-containing protein